MNPITTQPEERKSEQQIQLQKLKLKILQPEKEEAPQKLQLKIIQPEKQAAPRLKILRKCTGRTHTRASNHPRDKVPIEKFRDPNNINTYFKTCDDCRLYHKKETDAAKALKEKLEAERKKSNVPSSFP